MHTALWVGEGNRINNNDEAKPHERVSIDFADEIAFGADF